VAAGAGMLSVGGVLAGALGVSVVMGGVRMMEGEEVEVGPVVESGRSLRGGEGILMRVRNARVEGKLLSDEEIWENLTALDGEPVTVVTNLLLGEVLKAVPEGREFEFIDEAKERVSVKMMERLCFTLMENAVEKAPMKTVEGMLKRGLFLMSNPDRAMWNPDTVNSGRLGCLVVIEWCKMEPAEASMWVAENWEQLEKLGRAGFHSQGMYSNRRRKNHRFERGDRTFADELRQIVGREIFRSDGFGGVETFVSHFDDEIAATVWKPIFVYEIELEEGELYPDEFAERLVTFPDREPFGELKEVSWLSWFNRGLFPNRSEGRAFKQEYLEALPEHLAADFRRSCLEEVHQIGKEGEE